MSKAADRYIQYLQGQLDRPSKVGTRGQRKATKPVYVTPFGFDLAAGKTIRAKVDPNHYTDLSPRINAVTGIGVTDSLGSDEVQPSVGYSAARVIWFRNSTYSTTVATSEITDLKYLKYNGDRSSCPFGRDDSSSQTDMYEAFEEIKAAILGVAGFEINRVSLQRERQRY